MSANQIAEPSCQIVFSALREIVQAVRQLEFQQFLINHGIQIDLEFILPVFEVSQWLEDVFCNSWPSLDRAFGGQYRTFNISFSQHFGQAQEWIQNWPTIAADILNYSHYLKFQDYYQERPLESLLENNFHLVICEGGSDIQSVQNVTLEQLAMDYFIRGEAQFREVYGTSVLSVSHLSANAFCRINTGVDNMAFRRDHGLDEWGIVRYQNQIVDLSDLSILHPLQGYNFSHINVELVKSILKGFFVPNGHAVFQQPDGSFKFRLDIVSNPDPNELKSMLLTSYTQNGKTNQIIALTWILFFCHGYGTYILCRSDAQEYNVLVTAIEEFNSQLVNWSASSPSFQGNDLIKRYRIDAKPLSEVTYVQLQKQTLNNPEGHTRCICRIRLLQASNATRAVDEVAFLNEVQQFGETANGRHRFAVIVDEAQNARQTIEVVQQLERAVLKLFKKVSVGIEVSATQEASLVLQTNQSVEMLFIPAKPDYFGYARRLSTERQIEIEPIEEFLNVHFPDTGEDMIKEGVTGIVQKIAETFDQPRHWLCVVSAGRNDALRDMGNRILTNLNAMKYEKPVIIVLAVASSGNGGGSVILCNQVAQNAFTPSLIAQVDRKFFITQSEIKDKLTPQQSAAFQARYGNPKRGAVVKDPRQGGAGNMVTIISRRCTEENIGHTISDGITKVTLPYVGGYYRLRMQLTIVEALMKRVMCPSYTVITIGNRLIREGITPKTANHTLAPEKMFCLYPNKGFEKRTVISLTQTMGRLCGIRKDNIKPTLFIRRDCLETFQKVIGFNDDTMHEINAAQSDLTVEDIMITQSESIVETNNPLFGKILASRVWPREKGWPGIAQMRSFFSAQYSNPNEFSFDQIRKMAIMVEFLENRRVDEEEVDEWCYAKDSEEPIGSAAQFNDTISLFFNPILKNWVDQSAEDGNYDPPLAVRHFRNDAKGIRLNCAGQLGRQGLVVCTCETIFAGRTTASTFTRCDNCCLYYHNNCLPFKEEVPLCNRCIALPEANRPKYKPSINDEEDDEEEMEEDDNAVFQTTKRQKH